MKCDCGLFDLGDSPIKVVDGDYRRGWHHSQGCAVSDEHGDFWTLPSLLDGPKDAAVNR